jgi:hypothetical protein
VTLRSIRASNEIFHIETALDNISAGGFFLWLQRPFDPGARLAVVIRLSTQGAGARVSARGVVKRVEVAADGLYGVAVKFAGHRVIFERITGRAVVRTRD